MKDLSAIKNNRDKLFDSISNAINIMSNSIIQYVNTLSERTLSIIPIVILYCIFIPSYLANLNLLSDKLPSLDSVLLVSIALFIMTLHAILKNDRLLILIHVIGFVINSIILSMIILR
jgi:hypothetical protein